MTKLSDEALAQQPPQASASERNETDVPNDMGFIYDLTSAPCFRQSTMYGIGGGTAIGALSLLRNRTRSHLNDFFTTMAG